MPDPPEDGGAEAPAAGGVRRRLRGFALAALFLFPLRDRLSEDAGWRRAGQWFSAWGLIIGLFYAAGFSLGWRVFGEYQYIRFVPAVVVLALDLGFCGYRFVDALCRELPGGRGATAGEPITLTLPVLLAVLLLAMFKYAILLALPVGYFRDSMSPTWRAGLGPLYVQPAIYHPLILMPLWGRWAMMLAMRIGCMAANSPARLRSMAGGLGLRSLIGHWLAVSFLTMFFVSPPGGQLILGVVAAPAVFLAAYLTSFALAKRHAGQTEGTILLAGLVGELAFLMTFLPIANYIYWY